MPKKNSSEAVSNNQSGMAKDILQEGGITFFGGGWLGTDFVGVMTLGPYSLPKGRLKIIFQTLLVICKGKKDAFLVKYPINYKNKSSSQTGNIHEPYSTPWKMVPCVAFLQ